MRQRGFRRVCSNKFCPRRLEMCVTTRTTAWAGIYIGKTHHWICAVDAGRALVSVKVANIEAADASDRRNAGEFRGAD